VTLKGHGYDPNMLYA